MNRRETLTATLGLGALAIVRSAGAQTKAGERARPDPRADLQAAIAECQRTGEECVAHCAIELGQGNKGMANCNTKVHEMLAMTRAMATLAALQSSQAKALAALCATSCAACREACAEHKAHFAQGMHLACKACMEACDRCASACKAFAA